MSSKYDCLTSILLCEFVLSYEVDCNKRIFFKVAGVTMDANFKVYLILLGLSLLEGRVAICLLAETVI